MLPGTEPLRGTLSDAEGYFSLPQVLIGRHTLKVGFLGYGEIIIPNILVTSGKKVSLDVRLEEQVVRGAEAIIKGKRDTDMLNNEFGTLSVRTFNAVAQQAQQLKNVGSTTSGSTAYSTIS